MLRITLPARLKSVGLVAGVKFTDGTATVPTLGSHTRRYFGIIGATIAEPSTVDEADTAAPSTVEGDGDPLADRTVAELRGLAAAVGIDLPSRASKAEILQALSQEED